MKFIDPTGMDSLYFQSNYQPTPGQQSFSLTKSGYDLVARVGKGGADVISATFSDVVVTPNGGRYEHGGIITNYNGDVIGEKGLEIVSPEFYSLMIGRVVANAFGRKEASSAAENILSERGSATKGIKTTKSLVEQGDDLVKLNGGKNSVTLRTPK